MRILHATDTTIYNYDGISTYINELINAAGYNHEIRVITTTPHSHIRRDFCRLHNIKVHELPCFRVPGKPKFIIVRTAGVQKLIDDFNPDLIWIHTIGTVGMKVAKIAKNKYNAVYTKHCFDAELWSSYLKLPVRFNGLLNYAANTMEAKVVSSCKNVIYHLRNTAKVNGRPYYHKFLFQNPPLQKRFFQRINESAHLASNILTFGFCGRCDPDKGLANTVAALKLFKNKHPQIAFKFLLIGDGPEAHRLKKENPWLNIEITGFTNDVIPYLDKLDAFILSSHQETTSLASLEAYARGLPIFSLPIGYLSEHPTEIEQFYIFNTPQELADLLHAKLLVEPAPAKRTNIQNRVTSYEDLLQNVLALPPFTMSSKISKVGALSAFKFVHHAFHSLFHTSHT